ncbi:unnamed protein product [Phytophthora lilii]|uniref:Unnamed protein product n=1 Tax=Phytophthora lilii TaxID=2077276 RepID=A0A9W6TZE9_9STRA|nr:unnamed protein product [Phytophthora lilii]
MSRTRHSSAPVTPHATAISRISCAAMEKDLRDAYAALKLLRADLVKTRRDKRALESSLSQLQLQQQSHAAPRSERLQMQLEDVRGHWRRQAAQYEAKLAAMETQKRCNHCDTEEPAPEQEDNQQEDDELQKLALLNKLHSLTATVEQQTQTMLAQQAAFALQKGELETKLEETQHKLQAEKTKTADAQVERQAAKENYEFLETQVEILKEDKRKLEEEKVKAETKMEMHAQTSSILKQQLEEKGEEQERREMMLRLEYEQKMETLVEEVSARTRQENEMRESEMKEEHTKEMSKMQEKCRCLEVELKVGWEKTKAGEESQERYSMMLQDAESALVRVREQLEASEAERAADAKQYEANLVEAQERYATTLHKLEHQLAKVQNQLIESETKRSAEANEHDAALAAASSTIRDQAEAQELHSTTLRNLQERLTEVQTQLAVSEAKVAEVTKCYEEKLEESSQRLQHQQDAQNSLLHELENNLAEVQAQLAASETKRLTEAQEHEAKMSVASEAAAQVEKTAQAVVMEKKALQQELREARQTSKLTTEEFLKCQSVMEQKTQEHLKYLAQIEEQCESLESQLLAAEDHKDRPPVATPLDSPKTLKAFHGLSDNEIVSLPPSKAWKLLRSGISEIDGFLPHLQTLASAMVDAINLCGNHADTLPALCERLESNEKEQQPILSIALSLLRFAVMLKASVEHEKTPITLKLVKAFRKRVLDALAQWYEVDDGDNDHGSIPTPTFTITSRETAIILQNWTHDRTKQIGVRRWLARMEAYPGVPPLRGVSSSRVLELPPEGCTLDLEDMTPEVKDAFRLLLIPILKQNRALHVRVFTRYTGVPETTQNQPRGEQDNCEDAEKVWAMRIHVQSAITQRRANGSTRPTPLSLAPSPHSSPSPLAPTSPASSVSSSTSSTASLRLQIIQERLQYLHNNS